MCTKTSILKTELTPITSLPVLLFTFLTQESSKHGAPSRPSTPRGTDPLGHPHTGKASPTSEDSKQVPGQGFRPPSHCTGGPGSATRQHGLDPSGEGCWTSADLDTESRRSELRTQSCTWLLAPNSSILALRSHDQGVRKTPRL